MDKENQELLQAMIDGFIQDIEFQFNISNTEAKEVLKKGLENE